VKRLAYQHPTTRPWALWYLITTRRSPSPRQAY
jgi:hypothetical protein